MDIQFALEADLSVEEFLDLLHRSTLAQRRPVHDRATIEAMLHGASLILTARAAVVTEGSPPKSTGLLIGVSRAITDFAYCTYLSDLAVDEAFQRRGIGRQLIQRTHIAAGLRTTLVLLSAPKARSYYPHIGMQAHESCWIQPPQLAVPVGTDVEPERPAFGMAGPDAAGVQHGAEAQVVPLRSRSDRRQTDPQQCSGSVGQFFDQLASDYDQAIHRCFPRYSEMLDNLLSYLPPPAQCARILELGCGTGNLSVRLQDRYPDSQLAVVDISDESLATCRRRMAGANSTRLEFYGQDMRQLAFDSERFDLIVSTIAIHHLTSLEKQQLFANAQRWLRPGGALLYADQCSAESPWLYDQHMRAWHQISLAAGASEQEWEAWMEHQREHDHHDTAGQQLEWLAKAGFDRPDVLWRYLLWTIFYAAKV